MTSWRHGWPHWLWRLTMVSAAAVLIGFIAIPLIALVVRTGRAGLVAGLAHPSVWPAMRLSLTTSLVSLGTTVGLGTPLAWYLARSSSPSARWLETLIQLPVIIPPAVTGIALLMAFGRLGLLGPWLEQFGWLPALTPAAVVMAQLFVSAPFFIQAATTAFRRLDDSLLLVARSLGASPARCFFEVALPLAAPGLLGGAAMSWARALGEFGATLMFAGNLTGRTQTMPLAIYVALESDPSAAQAMAVILTVTALSLLLALRRFLSGWTNGPNTRRWLDAGH